MRLIIHVPLLIAGCALCGCAKPNQENAAGIPPSRVYHSEPFPYHPEEGTIAIRRSPAITRPPYVEVVCEVTHFKLKDDYYDRKRFDQFMNEVVGDIRPLVQGWRLCVLSPGPYQHKSIAVRFEGMMASGDPLYGFYWGHRYKIIVSEEAIGSDSQYTNY